VQGHECLVFFLGGIPQPDTNNPGKFLGMSGFSKNPTNPFLHPNMTGGANRNPPLFDFNAGRLQQTGDGNGMPAYLDSLNSSSTQPPQNYYTYFGNNNGSGYDPNDVNFVGTTGASPSAESDPLGSTSPIALTFASLQPLSGGITVRVTASPSPNPYTTGPTVGGTSLVYQNAQSFQIISAGTDGVFGVGGVYASSNTASPLTPEDATSPLAQSLLPVVLSNSSDPGLRTVERDNLTNFHNGSLE
jgi:general secretion pathway protein G